MNTLTNKIRSLSEKTLITYMTLASVVISTWIMYIQRGWITEDSILYFEIAKLFAAGQWKQGFAMYGWPLYPTLIALLHKLTGLGVQQAAQVWNVFFFALTTYGFLTLVRLAGGSKRVIVCGAILLLSAPYIVGDVLPMLLRDEGFWAFFLISLVFLLRFYRTGEFKYALYWQLCIIIAMLFRIEAFVYLLLAPLFILTGTTQLWHKRLFSYFLTQVLALAAGLSMGLLLAFSPYLQLEDLGRIQELFTTFSRLYLQMTEGLGTKSELMGELILGKYLDDYGMLGILLTLVSIVIAKIIGATGWPAVLVLAMPQMERLHGLQDDARKLIIWIIAIGGAIAVIIILNRFILSSRYLAPTAFMLVLLGAFALSNMWNCLKIKNPSLLIKQVLLGIVLLMTCANLVKNMLPPSDDHNFEQSAAAWMKENSSPQKTIFINNAKLRYYAGQPYIGKKDSWESTLKSIKDQSIYGYDYLVLSLNGKKIEQQQQYLSEVLPQYKIVNKFRRGTKKVVLIYSKHKVDK